MGKRIARVWTPRQGRIQRPLPLRKSSLDVPSNPRRRDQCESATARSVARKSWRVLLKAWRRGINPGMTTPDPRLNNAQLASHFWWLLGDEGAISLNERRTHGDGEERHQNEQNQG